MEGARRKASIYQNYMLGDDSVDTFGKRDLNSSRNRKEECSKANDFLFTVQDHNKAQFRALRKKGGNRGGEGKVERRVEGDCSREVDLSFQGGDYFLGDVVRKPRGEKEGSLKARTSKPWYQ